MISARPQFGENRAVHFSLRQSKRISKVILFIVLAVPAFHCVAQETSDLAPPDSPSQAGSLPYESSDKDLTLDALGNDGSAGTKDSSGDLDLSLDQLDSGDGNSGESGASANSSAGEDMDSGSSTGNWRDNLRFVVDVAFRPGYFGQTGNFGNSTFVGIDLHKVFSSDQGDIGTLTMQPFLTRIDNVQDAPLSIHEDPHDWAIDWRITNFNYTAVGRGKTNFRIGSFEIPFGLEQIVNTNGTLRDYTHFENFGLKTDWGVTLNGEQNDVEYELGVTRGSGVRYRRRDGPYLLAGRIGTSRDKPVVLGISALHGETINFGPIGGTDRRSRVGIDTTVGAEKYVFKSELSMGFENDDRVFTGLFEIDSFNSDESLLIYNQFVVRGISDTDVWDYEVRDSIGVRWQADSSLALSSQLSHFFDAPGSESRGTTIEVQARYRF